MLFISFYPVYQKLTFKTKGSYRVPEKATYISNWFQCLNFCEGLGRPGIKVKEHTAWMEKIPSTMVLHKHVYGTETIFTTMAGPLEKITSGKWLGVIRRGIYEAASEDSR